MNEIALSVLIPNFNYGHYIRETIDSVLQQAGPTTEIVVSDNSSTDNSLDVVKSFADPRVRFQVNPWNVGFAGNLEKVASMARGRRMIMLSSDDRMGPHAIETYQRLESALGEKAGNCVWGSSINVIDSKGNKIGQRSPDAKVWRDSVVDKLLSEKVGYPVRKIQASLLLNRSLSLMRNVLPFATVCYPKSLHDAVCGYAGGRLINPDKWFLWKMLSIAEHVYTIDHNLFDYRVHSSNQGSQQRQSGALKHIIDQYVATFDLPERVLKAAGLSRPDLAKAYIEHDIVLRGLALLADGERFMARRYFDFGKAAYPQVLSKNRKAWALRLLLMAGPIGTMLARAARAKTEAKWRSEETLAHTKTVNASTA